MNNLNYNVFYEIRGKAYRVLKEIPFILIQEGDLLVDNSVYYKRFNFYRELDSFGKFKSKIRFKLWLIKILEFLGFIKYYEKPRT
jgi:hypothetical protein